MEHYKAEHRILLKEAMKLLELTLWKAKLEENRSNIDTESVAVVRKGASSHLRCKHRDQKCDAFSCIEVTSEGGELCLLGTTTDLSALSKQIVCAAEQ